MIDGISTIGFIGAGNIASQVARLALRRGYRVVLSNSRGPETLAALVASLGDGASAATPADAAAAGDVLVVAMPTRNIGAIPAAPTAGKIVIDSNNYYHHDGPIAPLDDGVITTSGLLQQTLPDAKVVKVFNHIQARHLLVHATPAGSPDRRALAMFGDDLTAKSTVAALLDDLGFDAVDGGVLAQSWRIEPGQPGYGPWSDRAGMTRHLADAGPAR